MGGCVGDGCTYERVHAKSLQSCPTLCNPMDYNRPGSSEILRFFRQEYLSGLPCPPAGNLPDLKVQPMSFMSPELAGCLFTTSTTSEAWMHVYMLIINFIDIKDILQVI